MATRAAAIGHITRHEGVGMMPVVVPAVCVLCSPSVLPDTQGKRPQPAQPSAVCGVAVDKIETVFLKRNADVCCASRVGLPLLGFGLSPSLCSVSLFGTGDLPVVWTHSRL